MKRIYREELENGRILKIDWDDDTIKNACVNCKKPFHDDEGKRIKRYETRGNYCTECNIKCSKKHYKDN